MTALAADRKTDKYSPDDTVEPPIVDYPVKAATKIFAGSIVCIDTSGRAVPASADPTLRVVGKAQKFSDNTASGAADGDVRVPVERGVFYFTTPSSGVNQITKTSLELLCFASDDNTVNLTDNGGVWPAAGPITTVRADGQVGVFLGHPSLYQTDPEVPGGGAAGQISNIKVRAIVTANVASLAAFAGVTGGSSTNSDGVLAVQGDVVALVSQTTATQNGLYVVGVVSAGTAPLTRHDSTPTGSTQPSGLTFQVGGEGTLYKNTTWKAMVAASTWVVDTTDPKFFPTKVSWSCALVAGTMTAGAGATAGAPANMAVFSTNSKLFITRRTANTTASTIAYALNGTPTAGAPGTGAISGMATVAAGTINAADISTCDFLLDNQL